MYIRPVTSSIVLYLTNRSPSKQNYTCNPQLMHFFYNVLSFNSKEFDFWPNFGQKFHISQFAVMKELPKKSCKPNQGLLKKSLAK